MKTISIIIVDDHKLFREICSEMLNGSEQLNVIGVCGTCEEAVEMATKHHPEIVLMDINMKPVSGFEIILQMRGVSPHTKFLGLSIHSEMEYVKKLIELGASGYLTKDCSIEEMIKAILQVNQGGNYICDAIKENVLQRMFEENGTTPTLTSLTDTELQIVNLIKDGMPSKKIAFHLNISLKTVEVHRHNVLNKLDVKNSASLVNFFSTHHIAI